MNKSEQGRSGLVIQPGALGDTVLTLPLVRLVKEQLRLDEVVLMGQGERAQLLAGRSAVDKAINIDDVELYKLFQPCAMFDLPVGDRLIEVFRPYELIVTFLGDDEGDFERNLIYTGAITHALDVVRLESKVPAGEQVHAAEYFLRQWVEDTQFDAPERLTDYLAGPWLWLGGEDLERGRALLASQRLAEDRPIVAVHPGSGGVHKCWPLKNFCRLGALLADRGYQVVFVIGPAERERWGAEIVAAVKAQVPLLEDVSLAELAAVLGCCAAHVGNDSGVSHLAAALGVGTVAIFGPTELQHWRPLGPQVRTCQAGQPDQWPTVEEVLAEVEGLEEKG